MSINKKIKKYVNEMPAPEASKVLPEEALNASPKANKSFRWQRFAYAGTGLACAAIIGVAALNLSNTESNKVKKPSGVLNIVSDRYSDGEVKGEASTNKTEGIVDAFTKDEAGLVFGASETTTSGVDGYYSGDPTYSNSVIGAGTLTGGELRDLPNWDNYLRNMNKSTLTKWCVLSDNRVSVYVHNGDVSLQGIKLRLMQGENVLYTAITDINGNAYLFYNYDKAQYTPDAVELIGKDGSVTSYALSEYANSKNELEIEVKENNEDVNLDVLFLIDTTGSMGDELEYLKVEIKDVIERVADETNKEIRTSVNFYRDETDEYIVKYYDFRTDASEVAALVSEQYADGGGDYPEAVCEAVDNALNMHNWNENSIKLMFIVLDAPPHEEKAEELSKLIAQAAENGVRIIPIMSSGVDETTTAIFRSYAVMTGGTYLFLDDNSGVGFSHEIPADAKDYDSEYLNAMIIRVIGEYAGVTIDTSKVDVTPVPQQGN